MRPIPQLSGSHLQTMLRSSGVKHGETVSASVVRHLGGDRYVIAVRGTLYPTRSTVALHVGELLRATVTVAGGAVYLTRQATPTSPALTRFLTEQGLGSAPDRMVAIQLQTLGLPLSTSLITSLRRFADRGELSASLRVRLAALLADKGVEPTQRLVADLEAIVLGGYSQGRHHEREDRKNRKRRQLVPPLVRETEGSPHPVQLFNHFQGEHGNWLLLPVGAQEGISGSLQLFFPARHDSYQRSILTLRAEESFWAFVWDNPSHSAHSTIAIYTDATEWSTELGAHIETLARDLEPYGLSVDRALRTRPVVASFAIFQSEAIMRGVDTIV